MTLPKPGVNAFRKYATTALALAVLVGTTRTMGIADEPAQPSTIRVDAPLTSLSLVVTNDDPTNAVMCGASRLNGSTGRITFYPRSVAIPLTGRFTDSPRDLVFLDGGGVVVATITDVPASRTSGGAARLPSGIYARILVELAPAESVRTGIVPGARLFLPRHFTTAPVPTAATPCVRDIR